MIRRNMRSSFKKRERSEVVKYATVKAPLFGPCTIKCV